MTFSGNTVCGFYDTPPDREPEICSHCEGEVEITIKGKPICNCDETDI